MGLAGWVCELKSEFRTKYSGGGHLREPVPLAPVGMVPATVGHLRMLHRFAEANPIYRSSQDASFLQVLCRVYRADINQYWLDSIKHEASCQSFYPTWLLSAYVLTAMLKTMDRLEVVDVGSGDGRIAYCARIVGMKAYGIEVDDGLVQLQQQIRAKTGVDFGVTQADATRFNYLGMGLVRPTFIISGLPEMGGEALADEVIASISSRAELGRDSLVVLMGKSGERNVPQFGWGDMIRRLDLKVEKTVWLPTHWTAEQDADTPHLLVRPHAMS